MAPAWPGVMAFTTMRYGGPDNSSSQGFNLADPHHRQWLERQLSRPVTWLDQVHGIDVVDEAEVSVGRAGKQKLPQADAVITSRPDHGLAILTADCLPVVIGCAQGRMLGVAHAGWRGLAAGVLEATLRRLQHRALGASMVWRAWIGPSIRQPCFEVGADVYRAFTKLDPAYDIHFIPGNQPQKWLADLQGLAARRLYQAGVERVDVAAHCTCRDADRFYSYRCRSDTGRQATVAWLTGANHLPSLTAWCR